MVRRKEAQTPRVEAPIPEGAWPRSYRIPRSYKPEAKVFWFSSTEIKHLILSTLIVMGVGLSIVSPRNFFPLRLTVLIGSAVIFAFSFISHELAHKAAAQYYGMWAEFRLTVLGALITLFSIISPIKLISPGAVVIAGEADKKTVGKTSIAGPAVNLVLSALFIPLAYYYPNPLVIIGAIINPWIALFNLIPFSILDGEKILWWNKKVWAVSFSISLALTFMALELFQLF